MRRIINKKELKEKRRALRNNPTYTEKVLWTSLRKKQILGVRFLRQYSVGNFIIDFYAPSIKLAIEVDGSSHIGKEEYDKKRQKYIEAFDIKMIRFTDEEVMGNTNIIISEIEKIVANRLLELIQK